MLASYTNFQVRVPGDSCQTRRLVHNAIVMKHPLAFWPRLVVAALFAVSAAAPLFAAEAGRTAPAFSLPVAAGDTVALASLRGKVVYVDFWASWCGPCRRSFPWMNEMQQKYGARGLIVVAVNVDKKRADAERFLTHTPGKFLIVYDPAGTTPAAYAVQGMPSSYLIDRSGMIAYVERGFQDEHKAALEARIAALLAAGK